MIELSEISADGELQGEIDLPPERHIVNLSGRIRGWFTSRNLLQAPETFQFRANGIVVPHREVSREDVEDVLPDSVVIGFEIPYDLATLMPYIEDYTLPLELLVPGYDPVMVRFTIEHMVLAACLAAASV